MSGLRASETAVRVASSYGRRYTGGGRYPGNGYGGVGRYVGAHRGTGPGGSITTVLRKSPLF